MSPAKCLPFCLGVNVLFTNPHSNVYWPDVALTSVLSFWLWVNVGPTCIITAWVTTCLYHYNGVIMGATASQLFFYSTVCSGTNQRKPQSSALLAFVRRIHRWPVNSLHKGPVTRKMFPFDDVIVVCISAPGSGHLGEFLHLAQPRSHHSVPRHLLVMEVVQPLTPSRGCFVFTFVSNFHVFLITVHHRGNLADGQPSRCVLCHLRHPDVAANQAAGFRSIRYRPRGHWSHYCRCLWGDWAIQV